MHKHNPKLHLLVRKLPGFGCLLFMLAAQLSCAAAEPWQDSGLEPGFVMINTEIPSILLDVRYAGSDNFVGTPITGYAAHKVYLTKAAVVALNAVQIELAASGLGLKVFDGYRPQRAVDHFVRWAQDLQDTRMQARYYPSVAKQDLFRDGYIAERSGHSRGSTVDLTLIDRSSGDELDMGSSWDFFDPVSWPASSAVSATQFANRLRLQEVMLRHGFLPLSTEWWHFTLQDEPFPQQYFDFVIR